MTNDPVSQTGLDRPVQLTIPRRLFYTVLVVGFVFACAEVVSRVQVQRRNARRAAAAKKNDYSLGAYTSQGRVAIVANRNPLKIVRDQQLIYRYLPNQKLKSVSINARGFRGQDWTDAPASGSLRIAFIGGSTAFGYGCEHDGQSIPARLGEFLQKHLKDRKVEVLNLGVIGYLAEQECNLFRHYVVDWKPNVVVVFDGWNDFHEGSRVVRTPPESPAQSWFFQEIDGVLTASSQAQQESSLLEYSSLYRGLQRRWRREAARVDQAKQLQAGHYRANSTALAHYSRQIAQLVMIARTAKVEVLLAPQPELIMFAKSHDQDSIKKPLRVIRETMPGYESFAGNEYPRYIAAAKTVSDQHGANFFDPRFIFAGTKKGVFRDVVHLTARGNEVVAKCLGERIRRMYKN